jgi:23S rRNA pseudouridine2457 synthase
MLCQFTDGQGRDTLKKFIKYKNLYPAGRLDRDSEGLVCLTDDGMLQHLISHPKLKLKKSYWVQIEGIPSEHALQQLREGILLKDGKTRPAEVEPITEPTVWPRLPPVRYRATIPTCWINLSIKEGKNRQVRRMTAAVGHPTLRLIRHTIGPFRIDNLQPGQSHQVSIDLLLEDPHFLVAWKKYTSPKSRQEKSHQQSNESNHTRQRKREFTTRRNRNANHIKRK